MFVRSEHLKLHCGDAILRPFVSCDVVDLFGGVTVSSTSKLPQQFLGHSWLTDTSKLVQIQLRTKASRWSLEIEQVTCQPRVASFCCGVRAFISATFGQMAVAQAGRVFVGLFV